MNTLTPETDTPAAVLPTPSAAKVDAKGHLDYVDGLRGLAIAQVLLFHIWEFSHDPGAYWWNPLFWGYAGVTLFLLLSGFCLYWPMVRPNKPSPEPRLIDFAKRRAHRILPPYFIVLSACTILAIACTKLGFQWPDDVGGGTKAILTTFFWHVFMVHNLRPEHIFTLDGPFWSLALETSLYVAMPILVVLARKKNILWVVVGSAIVTIAYRIFCDRFMGGSEGWRNAVPAQNFVLIEFLPGQIVVFALGMWAATLISRGRILINNIALAGLIAICLGFAGWLEQHFTRYNPFSDVLFAVGFFAIILMASKPGNILSSAMRWRPIVRLGQISYSVYLLHYPIMKLAYEWTGVFNRQDRVIFTAGLVFLIPILIISYIFHIYCERPFMNSPQTGENKLRFSPLTNPQSQTVDIPAARTASSRTP